MRFSKRTDWNTEESELAQAYRERVRSGLPIADLTASNPTRCGFDYGEELLRRLTDPAALDYDPQAKGSPSARGAVSGYYQDSGILNAAEQVLLTTSTSEAYGYLFKLLCDPGDEIVVPQPSYPLFDFLANAEVVRVVGTPLVYDYGWQLDLEALRRRISAKTRAIVLVHPNNPTGHFTTLDQSREVGVLCREHGLALIVDEVFLDYGFGGFISGEQFLDRSSFAGRRLEALTFIVSGMSKIAGLPQMKVAWLLAVGPGANEAMERLEVLADTYLSVNAPMQLALPAWLEGRGGIQGQIRERTARNLAAMDRVLAEQGRGEVMANRLMVEGGWYAVVRVPAVQEDEQTVRELLALGVWVHPGCFYGFGKAGWLVVSLLTPCLEFATGLELLMRYLRLNLPSYCLTRKLN